MSVVSSTATRTSMLSSQELVLPVSDAQDQSLAGGYFLDVQAKAQDIQIDGMTVSNSFIGSTVMFLFCKGTHVGKEAIPNMWTLAGQLEIKESNVPSTVSFSVPVCLGKGEVAGFYIFCKQNGLSVRPSIKDEVLIDHDLASVKCGKQIEKDQSSVYTKGYVSPKGSIFCHAMAPPARYETPPDLTAMSARLSKIEETLVVMVLHEAQQKQAALEARIEMQDDRIAKLEQDMLARMVSFDERMTKLAMDVSVSQAESNTALRSEIKQTMTKPEDDTKAATEQTDTTAAMTKYATSIFGGKAAEKSVSLDERTGDLPAPKQSPSMLTKDASKDTVSDARKPSPSRPAFVPVTPPTPSAVTPMSTATSSTPSSTAISTTKATKDVDGAAVSSTVVSRFTVKSVVREGGSSEVPPALASSTIQEDAAETAATVSSTLPPKVSDADKPLDTRKSSPAKLNLAALSAAGKPPEVSKSPPPDPRNSSPARMKPSSLTLSATSPAKDKESSEKPAVSKTTFEFKKTGSASIPAASATGEAKQDEASEKQDAPKKLFDFSKPSTASATSATAPTASSTREAKQDKEPSEKPAATKFTFDFSKPSASATAAREAKKQDSEKPAVAKTTFDFKKTSGTKTSAATDQEDDKGDALSKSLARIAAIRGKSKDPPADTTS